MDRVVLCLWYGMIWVTMKNMKMGEGQHLELWINRVAQLYYQALGVHLFVSYEPYEVMVGLF